MVHPQQCMVYMLKKKRVQQSRSRLLTYLYCAGLNQDNDAWSGQPQVDNCLCSLDIDQDYPHERSFQLQTTKISALLQNREN